MYHNSITYTTALSDGMRYEQTAVRMSRKPLTTRGAERILRKDNPERPSLRVSRVQAAKWAARCVAAILLTASASFAASKAPAAPKAPCEPHTIDGKTVSARVLKSGNLSVCKPPETRVTFKVTAKATAPQVHKATPYSCEYWLPLGADSAGPKADGRARAALLAAGFDACVDAMHSTAEKGGAK